MDKNTVIVIGVGDSLKEIGKQITRHAIELDLIREAVPVQHELLPNALGECAVDHGERTNYKLQDQPFFMRGKKGKMRGW